MAAEAGQGSRAYVMQGFEDGPFRDDHLLPSPSYTLTAACAPH